MTPEQRLWQTVVMKALTDATAAHPASTDDIRARRDADDWVRSGGRDYRLVCALAGLDPDFIREAYVAGRIDGALLRAKEKTEAA